jgi:hypothetical protein
MSNNTISNNINRNTEDREEFYINANLDLTNQPADTLYFNKENNYNYNSNWFNYREFQCIPNNSIVGEVVQYSKVPIENSSLDLTKQYTINSNAIVYGEFSGAQADCGNSYIFPFTIPKANYSWPFEPTIYVTVGPYPGYYNYYYLEDAILYSPDYTHITVYSGTYYIPFGGLNINKSVIIQCVGLCRFIGEDPITLLRDNIWIDGMRIEVSNSYACMVVSEYQNNIFLIGIFFTMGYGCSTGLRISSNIFYVYLCYFINENNIGGNNTITGIEISRSVGNSFIESNDFYNNSTSIYYICIRLSQSSSPYQIYQGNLVITNNRNPQGIIYQFFSQTSFSGSSGNFSLILRSNSTNETDAFCYLYVTSDYLGNLYNKIVCCNNNITNDGKKGVISLDSSSAGFSTKRIWRTGSLPLWSMDNAISKHSWTLSSAPEITANVYTSPRIIQYWQDVVSEQEFAFGYNSYFFELPNINLTVVKSDVYHLDITALTDWLYIQSGSYNTRPLRVIYIDYSFIVRLTLPNYGISDGYIIYYENIYIATILTWYNVTCNSTTDYVRICTSLFCNDDSRYLTGPYYPYTGLAYTLGFYKSKAYVRNQSGAIISTLPTVSNPAIFIIATTVYNNVLWNAIIEGASPDVDNMSLAVDLENVYVNFIYDPTKTITFRNGDGSVAISWVPDLDPEIEQCIGLVKYNKNGECEWATKLTGFLKINFNQNLVGDYGNSLFMSGSYRYCKDIYNSPALTTSDKTSFSLPTPNYYAWTNVQEINSWVTLCIDYFSGSNIVLANQTGMLYYSYDNGISWIYDNTFQNLYEILKIRCDRVNGWKILITKNDSVYVTYGNDPWVNGIDTVSIGDNKNWSSVAINPKGDRMLACISGGKIYWSYWSDDNEFFESDSPNLLWTDLCMTDEIYADISFACAIGSPIYRSDDNGETWYPLINSPYLNWTSITCDETGQHIYVGVAGFYIYSSHNGGLDWKREDSGIETWIRVVCNKDGQYVAAASQNGQIWMSTDFGTTWIPSGIPRNWSDLVCTREQLNPLALFYATEYNGRIFVPLGTPIENSFLIKYHTLNGSVEWINYLGGGSNYTTSMCMNPKAQTLYIAGSYADNISIYNAEDITLPVHYLNKEINNSNYDLFIVKYNMYGGDIIWNTHISSVNQPYYSLNEIKGLSVDNNDILGVTGYYTTQLNIYDSNDFLTTQVMLNGYIFFSGGGWSEQVYPNNIPNGNQNVFTLFFWPNGVLESYTFLNGIGQQMGTNLPPAPQYKGSLIYNPFYYTDLYYVAGSYKNPQSDFTLWVNRADYLPIEFLDSHKMYGLYPDSQNSFFVQLNHVYARFFEPNVPAYVNPDPFPIEFNVGGCNRTLVNQSYVDSPIETWGGLTGWNSSVVTSDDINTGIICKYGHDMGNTRPFINGIPGITTKEYSHLALSMTIPSFPTNDPQPIGTSSVPYGYIPIYAKIPIFAGLMHPTLVTTTSLSFNNLLNNETNLILKPSGNATLSNLYILGLNPGDKIRIQGTTIFGSKYISLTVKEITPSFYNSLTNIPSTIVFEESTIYANSVWNGVQAFIYSFQREDVISNPLSSSTYFYLPMYYQPKIIDSGDINVTVQVTPKEYLS